jgi:hypothetical protein
MTWNKTRVKMTFLIAITKSYTSKKPATYLMKQTRVMSQQKLTILLTIFPTLKEVAT